MTKVNSNTKLKNEEFGLLPKSYLRVVSNLKDDTDLEELEITIENIAKKVKESLARMAKFYQEFIPNLKCE